MKGESPLHHELCHFRLEGGALQGHWAPQPQAESDKHSELVEEKHRARDQEPEQASGGVKAVEDREGDVVQVCPVKHFKEATSPYDREGSE